MKEFTMDESLQDMEPKNLWKHFLEISSIPRSSGNETASINHLEQWAKALGHEVIRDSVGNLVIRKEASDGMGDRAGVVIQAHIDMVCEKNEGTRHDFLKDPLRIYREGDLVRAHGTTLGADNGIGVAAALAILESDDLKHGPLEILITVDEETGLTGANEFQGGILKGKYFLNLDSEDEGILTIGCAGGLDTTVTRALHLRAADPGKAALRLKVAGLKGGHSGIDIDRGRGNSIAILARILQGLRPKFRMDLASLDGGNKRNAIPREAFAALAVDPGMEDDLRDEIAHLENVIRNELGGFDPGLALSLEPVDIPEKVMSEEDFTALLGFILNAPNGVISMTPDMDGLVQTSCNLGVVQTVQGKVEIILLGRSSIDSSKVAQAERIEALASLAGMECSHNGGYPGWKPEPGTWLVKTMTSVFEEMYSRPMEVKALHAGLECGIIGERYPDMEMVSIGPNMNDVHTPEENVSISSVSRFWEYLKKVIETI
jgi:dipeptidase D